MTSEVELFSMVQGMSDVFSSRINGNGDWMVRQCNNGSYFSIFHENFESPMSIHKESPFKIFSKF